MEPNLTGRRIVVVGGFGNFGARICRRLAKEPGLDIVATARTVRRDAPGGVGGACLDIDSPLFARELAALRPWVVVHCAGPFQGQNYRVADAALACGSHYLDLADGRAFVDQFASAMDGKHGRQIALPSVGPVPCLHSHRRWLIICSQLSSDSRASA